MSCILVQCILITSPWHVQCGQNLFEPPMSTYVQAQGLQNMNIMLNKILSLKKVLEKRVLDPFLIEMLTLFF